MASKFRLVDPSQGDDVMATMAGMVNDRMEKAVDELAEKHASGRKQEETSVDRPTGDAYRAAAAVEARRAKVEARRAKEAEEAAQQAQREDEILQQLQKQVLDEDEDDLLDDEGDAELLRIRERRLREMKTAHQQKMENLGKGHGQFREITQDEFLPEVTGSKKVICHFYSPEFMRCKIMDKHLGILAPQHVEAKFIKINAEKAPFFVGKLQVRTLPTLVLFVDGIATQQIKGYEGFASKLPQSQQDEFPTSMLAQFLAKCDMIDYTAPPTEDELHRFGLAGPRGAVHAGLNDYDDLSD